MVDIHCNQNQYVVELFDHIDVEDNIQVVHFVEKDIDLELSQ